MTRTLDLLLVIIGDKRQKYEQKINKQYDWQTNVTGWFLNENIIKILPQLLQVYQNIDTNHQLMETISVPHLRLLKQAFLEQFFSRSQKITYKYFSSQYK